MSSTRIERSSSLTRPTSDHLGRDSRGCPEVREDSRCNPETSSDQLPKAAEGRGDEGGGEEESFGRTNEGVEQDESDARSDQSFTEG